MDEDPVEYEAGGVKLLRQPTHGATLPGAGGPLFNVFAEIHGCRSVTGQGLETRAICDWIHSDSFVCSLHARKRLALLGDDKVGDERPLTQGKFSPDASLFCTASWPGA